MEFPLFNLGFYLRKRYQWQTQSFPKQLAACCCSAVRIKYNFELEKAGVFFFHPGMQHHPSSFKPVKLVV